MCAYMVHNQSDVLSLPEVQVVGQTQAGYGPDLASGLPQYEDSFMDRHHSYLGEDSRLLGQVWWRSTSEMSFPGVAPWKIFQLPLWYELPSISIEMFSQLSIYTLNEEAAVLR